MNSEKAVGFVPITITVRPDQLERVDELARRLDRTRSWLVREALHQLLSSGGDTPGGAHLNG